ncbi:uncharacterized protein LOC116215284 [Punica granatum]|uniref:Uncharacterized protein n=2 Tax=Punica granatum TaxID=22663 RepID=A0A218WCM4_PUNGR|nr:uncharacterized protein LOC116215284 [Punica granatum]OWM70617.1 hypothetical protein CDL15_Pgr014290 [Punica granatum]PKI55157.1 hypothetical protein CRG98_024448 [Punica granatum]
MAHMNFEALRNLHESANHLLHSPVIRQSLVHHGKWTDDVSEASLRMLDVCSTSRDVLLLVKDHIQDLRITLRRSNSIDICPGEDNPIAAYNMIKRKLKKETVKCLRSLKGMKGGSDGLDLLPVDHRLNVVVDMLREVRMTIVAIVESTSTLVSVPWLEGKSTRGSLATKLMRSRGPSLSDTWVDRAALESADTRLEAVEIAIEDLEIELECMFRRLIQTRVSLLNILTY